MATAKHNKHNVFPVRVPREGLAGWKKLYPILHFVLKRMGFTLSFDGPGIQEIDGGIHIKAVGDESPPPPWDCTMDASSGPLLVTVNPGYIGGHAPTISGTPIDDSTPPSIEISDTGTQIVFLKLQLTLTDSNGYIYQSAFDSAIIDVDTSLPSDDTAAGTYYLRLATYEDGIKQDPQPVIENLTWVLFDKLEGTSEALVNFFAA